MDRELGRQLARLTRVLRAQSAMQGIGWGLVAALAVMLLAAGAAQLTPLWYRAALWLALIRALAVGAVGGALIGWFWPRPLPQRLRLLDRRLGLADRLTTAWELSAGRIVAPPAIVRAQAEETLRTLTTVRPEQAFPLRPGRTALLTALVLTGALGALLFLPNPQETELTRRAALQQAAQEQAARLETIARQLETDPALSAEQRAAALQALEAASAALRDPSTSPEERLAALAEAERQLSALRSPEATARLEALSEAAPFSTAEVVQPLTEALQRGDAAAAADYLRSLTDPTGRPLTSEEMLALADAFAQMADSLQATDPALAEQFRNIAQEIYSGDMPGAQKAVQQAADALGAAAQAAAPNQALEQAQAQLQTAQQALGTTSSPAGSQMTSAREAGNAAQPGGNIPAGEEGGQTGHHEDTGSSAPFGPGEAARLEGAGGEITVPRAATEGTTGQPQTGQVNPARVPYREVYTTYSQAAEAELARHAYPPALRATIRQYFSGLKP